MKKEIVVKDDIGISDLGGDDWRDAEGAARAYAAFLEKRYSAEIEYQYPNAEIKIQVTVVAASQGHGPLVEIDDPMDLAAGEEQDLRECLLHVAAEAWTEWFRSEEAAEFYDDSGDAERKYAVCRGCGNVVYRIPGHHHGDGQIDDDDNPVWLLAEDDRVAREGLPEIYCGCNL